MVEEGVLSARTINKRLQQLHTIFKRAQRNHGLAGQPGGRRRAPAVHGARATSPRSRSHEVEQLADAAVTEQDSVIFRVAAFTGLRLGELRGLRWGDIDWTRRVVFVRRSFTVDSDGPTKSGKVRSVPLVDQAARALDQLSKRERWTSDEDRVFVNDVGEPHRGLGAAAALLRGARRAPACRGSASTTSATPSGRSRCRRSRSPT